MPTYTGYVGNAGEEIGSGCAMWDAPLALTAGATFTGDGSSQSRHYSTSSSTLTLPSDEYPTEVSLSYTSIYYTSTYGFHNETETSGGIAVTLYDQDGSAASTLFETAISSGGTYHPAGPFNINNKNLAGKKIGLFVNQALHGWMSLREQIAITIETRKHTVTWQSGSAPTVTQNEYQLTVTRTKTATDSWSENVQYILLVDGVNKGTFSGPSMTITLTDNDLEIMHNFVIRARCATDASFYSDSEATTFIPASVHKTVKYYTDGAWVECIPHYYDGTEWVECYPYYWDGSTWVLCSH